VRVALLGLGLIGGSVARAAVAGEMRVRAWTPVGSGPGAAAPDGIEPADSIEDAIAGADLVVLAAPPLACLELIDRLAGMSLDPETVVTDVASTKRAIVERARSAGLRFVGGHPLAGKETTGYGASDPDLFRGRLWVLVPPEPADQVALDRVATLVEVCGAELVRMTAADHDRQVAAISHLPLLLAAALAESVAASPDWPAAGALAAGGWDSMTRLARGDVAMGAGIVATNATEIGARLAALRSTLDEWAAALESADVRTEAGEHLARARDALVEGS